MSSWSSWSSWANDSFVESAWSNKNSALMLLYSARTLTDIRHNQNFLNWLGIRSWKFIFEKFERINLNIFYQTASEKWPYFQVSFRLLGSLCSISPSTVRFANFKKVALCQMWDSPSRINKKSDWVRYLLP